MEEMIDLFADIVLPPIEYSAAYDPSTGVISRIGPSSVIASDVYKVKMDKDLAERVLEGKVPLSHCFVNIDSMSVEISEVKSIFKVDDSLHRIIDKEYAVTAKQDIRLTYNKADSKIVIEFVSESPLMEVDEDGIKKKLHWRGDADMIFYVTAYNDPNVLYAKFNFKLNDIINKPPTVNLIDVPERFSIYTNRIFRNYVVETV